MASYQAVGTGPVSFIDSNESQHEIPLSLIYFDDNGPNASKWPKYSANSVIVDAVLQQLIGQGVLTQGAAAASSPSLTIEASEAGTPGNAITVSFSYPNVGATGPDVAVSATETFANLTTDTVADALGTSAANATGIIFLKGAVNGPAVAQSKTVPAAFDLMLDDGTGVPPGAFTVSATEENSDATSIQVNVSIPPGSPAGTFTLQASWQKTVQNIPLSTLTTDATNPFATLVKFSGPANGPLPAAGTVVLSGGAAPSSATAVSASASVLSS